MVSTFITCTVISYPELFSCYGDLLFFAHVLCLCLAGPLYPLVSVRKTRTKHVCGGLYDLCALDE